MLEKAEGAIKNGKSRDRWNIGHNYGRKTKKHNRWATPTLPNKSGVNTYFREEQAVALSYKTSTVCSKLEYLPVTNEMEEYMGDFSL